MSDQPTPIPVNVVGNPTPTPTPAPSTMTAQDWIKWAALFALGASVLAMEWVGKVPAGTYMTAIVYPGLGAFGVYTAAKKLN